MPTKGKYDAVDAAHEFLQKRANEGTTFQLTTLLKAAKHWKEGTATTYLSKYLKDYVTKNDEGLYSVRPEFAQVTQTDFRNLQRQTKKVYQDYERRGYVRVISFEFLLPLTRQDKLRDALDRLFYMDTIVARIKEIGLARMQKILPRPSLDMSDPDYRTYVAEKIGELFGGYSVGHVNGRFRSAQLMAREEAWKHRYLVDEIAAVVRFIIPCPSARFTFEPKNIDKQIETLLATKPNFDAEARQIRSLFFEFFVEAIVRTIDKEDEIWLIETGAGSQLYIWAKPQAS